MVDEAVRENDAALAKLARATAAAPDALAAWHALAEINFSLRRFDDALAAAQKAHALQPDDLFINTTLSRIWMDRIGDPAAALAFPRTALFEPLGMTSAEMEADEHGTLVGSSYMYATARDWARLGLFLLHDGSWNGTPLLPAGFVSKMNASNGLPGHYSEVQSWLDINDDDAAQSVPADAWWLVGHDGQSIAVIPSIR